MTRTTHQRLTNRRQNWIQLGSLPVVAAIFVALNGLYLLLIAFGNITDYPTNQAFVEHVLSMDTTNFGAAEGTDLDPAVMWRSIDSPMLQDLGYVLIIAWEAAGGILLTAAFVMWIRERGGNFARARALSTIGLLMIILLFVGGFIDIGGEWFQMWKSTAWNGLDTAFRNAVIAGIALIIVHLPSPYWNRGQTDGASYPTRTDEHGSRR